MTATLPLYVKATGEYFDVPYQLDMKIYQLIEYVCQHSTLLSSHDPDDYYIIIDHCDSLDRRRTIEETGLDQPSRYKSLTVSIKTRVLIRRLAQQQEQARQLPVKKTSQKALPSPVNNSNLSNEVHILICGGPLVGKSSLINALCGCPVARTTNVGLDSCTKKTTSYQLGNIFFWDTPGIQQWSHLDINSYLNSSARCQTPICMFYCASPGSFAKLKQLEILVDECIRQRKIFCVLVVTNMFAHIDRHAILEEFKTILTRYVDRQEHIREKHGIWFYGNIGLCTMVNSQEFIDEDTNQRRASQGINELVLALIESFRGTYQLGAWLRTIEQNQQFWLDKQDELYKLTQKPIGTCLSEMV